MQKIKYYFQPKGGVQDMSYIEAETMSFNQIFDRDEDEYLEGDELLYWVRNKKIF